MIISVPENLSQKPRSAPEAFSAISAAMTAVSAGLMVNSRDPEENAVKAALEFGADIKKHKPRQLSAEIIQNSDIVITMTKAHKDSLLGFDNVKTLAELAFLEEDIQDPFGGSAEVYRNCAKKIKEYIEKIKL